MGDLGGVESDGVAGVGEGVADVGCVVFGLDPDAAGWGGVVAVGSECFEVVGVGVGRLVGGQAEGDAPVGLVGRDRGDGGADLSGVEEFVALGGWGGVRVEVEAVPSGLGGEVGEVVGGAGGGDGDAQGGVAGLGGVVFEGLGEVDEASCGGQDGVAELGEGGASCGAVEEGCAEVSFEGGDTAAGDRLGDAGGGCAVGEAASVADVDEGCAGS